MISLDTARELLDFRGPNRAISAEAAEEQLCGAVAVHNLLAREHVAYLADEVGMGKTYVALGAVALFRHFIPDFRLLVIAPRENIQHKWVKELRNFTRANFRVTDLRVRSLQGTPARDAVACSNLLHLVREATIDPDRDFFLRLTSFSLPLGRDSTGWKAKRDELLSHLPWARSLDFDLRSRSTFKDNFARAVCCALPRFDLVIVDEGHNLKHGLGSHVSDRNRVLAFALGHPSGAARGFRGYQPRAGRLLLLSATPLENDYRQLWNQLDVLGFGTAFRGLADPGLEVESKRELARRFLVRRVTAIRAGGESLTKNLYRREWRGGGVLEHDLSLEVPEQDRVRQKLIVGLVQKKVSELLAHERFNNSFQIGMLASFESFLQTAKVLVEAEDGDRAPTFDASDQTDDELEREGLDVRSINRLADSYRRRFGRELPHPKMDALVEEIAAGLGAGRKALVFVRRVASVKELQAKLEERYDQELFARLRAELGELAAELEPSIERYLDDRRTRRARLAARPERVVELDDDFDEPLVSVPELDDEGGLESFFAWFFRGEGPDGVLSGAALQRRMTQVSSAYSTLFEDNAAARLLGVRPGEVLATLAERLGLPADELAGALRERAGALLPPSRRKDARVGRLELFTAYQQAALERLRELPELAERAAAALHAYPADGAKATARQAGEGTERWLEEPTVCSALLERPSLRAALWPDPPPETESLAAEQERELRRQLLSSAARLGHAFIDLWLLVVRRLGTLQLGARQEDGDSAGLVGDYVELLDRQRSEGSGTLTAFRELELVARHHHLLLDVNFPELRGAAPAEATKRLGQHLGRQRPIGGMAGTVNRTLVRQFRMPGYPLVLITTDLLQEGEDLHTFCSHVYHYGISWMPSSMEQRVGRVDRVNSQTERRLSGLERVPAGEEKLQVFYPHLADTVEVLQVRRVLERLNRFLRLMHEDLGEPEVREKKVFVDQDLLRVQWDIEPITTPLTSAFPIRDELLAAPSRPLAIDAGAAGRWFARLEALTSARWPGLPVDWASRNGSPEPGGTAWIGDRRQPFRLQLRSLDGHVVLRCSSPIANLREEDLERLAELARRMPVHLETQHDARRKTWYVGAEGEVLLTDPAHDSARALWLVRRITVAADELERRLLPDVDASAEDFEELPEGSDRGD